MSDGTKVELKPVDFDPFALGAVERSVESTEAQRELWSSAQLGDEANCAFNESVSLDLKGRFDLTAFRDAVQAFVDRHEALRGVFSDDGLLYTISDHRVIEVPLEEGQKALERALREEVSQPFDLHRGPLFRARVVRLGPQHHRALFTGHHAAFDGWSCAVLLEELGKLYTERAGGPAAAFEAPGSFVAYAEDEAAFERSDAFSETLAYWQGQLVDGPILDLPSDRPRPPFRTFAADRVDVELPADLLGALKKFAAQHRTSFVSLMMAGYSAYLSQLTGQSEIVVGMPAAGQVVFGEDYLVGHCVNLLPVRLKCGSTFEDHLADTKRRLLDADEHRRLSFGRLLQSLKLTRDPSRIPLASVLFNVDQGMEGSGLKFGDLEVTFHSTPRAYETFELFVNASEVGGRMVLEAQYNTALFDRASIALRMRELIAFYRRVIAAPTTSLNALPIVDDETRGHMLGAWNQTRLDVDLERSIPALVAEAAERHRDREAVRDLDGASLSYGELLDLAGALAAQLRSEGLGPGDVVALCVERRADVVAAVLGISATGATYLPIDAGLPAERIGFMLSDAQAKRVVMHRALDAGLTTDLPRTFLDDVSPRAGGGLGPIEATPDGVAYLIYTSGSTGIPKGVMVPHRAVVNFLCGMLEWPGLEADTRFLATTTLSFDVSVVDLYLPLVAGGTIIMAPREVAKDGFRLADTLQREQITAMTATPATWRMLLEAKWIGHPAFKVLCAGEAFPPELAAPLLKITGEVWNMYGPTEATVYATGVRITDPDAPITIGRPVPNATAFVLDEHGRMAPPGVTGELCIGGAGLALGYKGRPELTAERFIDNPVADAPPGRIYRTGDEVTWRRDGVIFYVGRLDHQVKHRGYRIELGEIESVLSTHPTVDAAVVVLREDRPGDPRLVAYVTGRRPEPNALRDHLRAKVPDYMVPQHLVVLDAFPLTPSQKVDRKALPPPDGRPEERDGQPPMGPTETTLSEIWCEVLGLTSVMRNDDFFALGGHSLLAMRVAARVLDRMGTRLELRTLYQHPTLEGLAAQLAPPPSDDEVEREVMEF